MKKILTLLPVVALLAACGTTDPLGDQHRARVKEEQAANEKVAAAMPVWASERPTSDAGHFAVGMGEASSRSEAIQMARTNAMRELCYDIDGQVDSQTKNFATADTKTSTYESVTRTRCKAVDVTGSTAYGAKNIGKNPVIVPAGGKWHAYYLLVLPTGKNNVIREYKEQSKREERQAVRATEAFKELDKPN
jgi:hypothetical protein